MRNIDQVIVGLAGQQDGVVTRAELLDAGVCSKAIYRRSSSGLLVTAGTGVYTVPLLATSRTQVRAATATIPGSAASHFSAAEIHGIWVPEYCVPERPEIIIGRKRGHDLADVIVHESRRLPDSHMMHVDGLPVTTVARTFRDTGFRMSVRAASHMAQRIIADDLATASELASVHLALARRGRAGTVFTRLLLDSILGRETHPMSELEIRARTLFDENGLGCLISQFSPPWRDGVAGIVDFADPVAQVIVEVDGRRWHTVQQQLSIDKARDRLALKNGWAPLRFNWTEVVHDGDLTVEDIKDVRKRQLRR